jgi:hypothetical protein
LRVTVNRPHQAPIVAIDARIQCSNQQNKVKLDLISYLIATCDCKTYPEHCWGPWRHSRLGRSISQCNVLHMSDLVAAAVLGGRNTGRFVFARHVDDVAFKARRRNGELEPLTVPKPGDTGAYYTTVPHVDALNADPLPGLKGQGSWLRVSKHTTRSKVSPAAIRGNGWTI